MIAVFLFERGAMLSGKPQSAATMESIATAVGVKNPDYQRFSTFSPAGIIMFTP